MRQELDRAEETATEAVLPHMSLGQRVCAMLALAALVGGAVLLALSCCTSRQTIPAVPALPPAPPVIRMPEAVRIRLISGDTVEVGCRHGGTWFGEPETGEVLLASGTGPWTLSLQEGALALNGRPLAVESAELESAAGVFQLDGRSYRGKLTVRATDESGVETVNVLPPETYLASVVGSEMYADWPLNALMAQAVAARTYMLHTHAQKGHLTTVDMAYKGIAAETRPAELAVELTRGIVMAYNGRLFSAYFHSTCGGHTAPVDKVFGDELSPPLAGVACEWCRQSPAYRWRAELPARRIAQALSDWGVASVRSIRSLDTEPYGYPRRVLVNGVKRMDANQFRLAVGGHELKSTRFTVSPRGEGFLFEGRGFGHGVGLCQWGAFGLAEAGRDWRQILLHYYPGSQLQEIF